MKPATRRERIYGKLGDYALRPSGLSQSALSQAKPAAAIAIETGSNRTVIFPTFTHRTHRPPPMRGHRAFILGKQEWR